MIDDARSGNEPSAQIASGMPTGYRALRGYAAR